MNGLEYRFLEPLDVVALRGNKGFGEAGSYGESMMPPWPSVIAGALRSRILVDDGFDPVVFALGGLQHPSLGTPQQPGSFRIMAFQLARRFADGRCEILVAPPADLVIGEGGPEHAREAEVSKRALMVRLCRPLELPFPDTSTFSSYPLPLLPVLAEAERSKPKGGYWLTETGWRAYLAGRAPAPSELVDSRQLWGREPRVGVGLSLATRSAEESRLFTTEVISMRKRIQRDADGLAFDTGFLVAASGGALPSGGMLRVGGDGRGMLVWALPEYRLPEPDYAALAKARRCRLILATPGLFPGGWLPTGVERVDGKRFDFALHGVRGRLVSACVPRTQVISGWDLAQERPKPARRFAPAGSVYWLDELEATPEALRRLVAEGLWSEQSLDLQRRAEGFNRIWLGEWTRES